MSPKDEKLSGPLPLPGDRWVPRRKALVITALREGATTIEEICRRYSLSPDELSEWISAFERYGVPGLRSTRVQIYRQLESAPHGRVSRSSAQQADRAPPARASADDLPAPRKELLDGLVAIRLRA
jgi:transposase-like protein